MKSFDKKLKSGLKKCPGHRFGADYKHIKDNWFECQKCKAYHNVEDEILKDEGIDKDNVKIRTEKLDIFNTISYEF
jgi:hypothetical protein